MKKFLLIFGDILIIKLVNSEPEIEFHAEERMFSGCHVAHDDWRLRNEAITWQNVILRRLLEWPRAGKIRGPLNTCHAVIGLRATWARLSRTDVTVDWLSTEPWGPAIGCWGRRAHLHAVRREGDAPVGRSWWKKRARWRGPEVGWHVWLLTGRTNVASDWAIWHVGSHWTTKMDWVLLIFLAKFLVLQPSNKNKLKIKYKLN